MRSQQETALRHSGQRDYCGIARRYAEHVVAGKLPACKWVRLACQRQLDDLARKDWQYRFERKRATAICQFIEYLPHVKGKWASREIKLEPWQCFVLTTVFGWVDANGNRRFRTAYTEVPRKNAKTTICAGVGLYLLCADGEPGAEIYSAATTRDQAKISWEIAHTQAKRTADLLNEFGVHPLAHSITIPAQAGMFKPLSRDADTLEGLNVHGAIVDELHAHKTREVWDVLNAATGSRRQPLLWAITTAGVNRAGVCYEQRGYVVNILEGRHVDERYFGVIYGLDPEDDWTLRESWIKANPNFGVSVLEDDIRTLCDQARASAQSQNNFLTKRLNVWVNAGTAYFNMLAWDACEQPGMCLADFEGEECWLFVDLASKTDVAAKILLFRRDGSYYVFGTYYLPEDAVEAGNPNYDFYSGWSRDNLLTLTPGNVIDFTRIEADLLEDAQRFSVHDVGYDPWQATELATRMQAEGLPMAPVPMTVQRLSEPMKVLEALILQRKIHHDGDPVLGWMVSNVTAKIDLKENVFPRKDRPENKIDGAVALIGALGRAIVHEEQVPGVRWLTA
jgi:phage terminase large subunit-like protein